MLLVSCEKEATEPNPADLIQGKWRIIFLGDGDNLIHYETQCIYEYYNDSLMREYDTILGQYTFYAKYKIDNLLLTEYYLYPEDTFIIEHKYEFYENNTKLKLVYHNIISNFSTTVYERVE